MKALSGSSKRFISGLVVSGFLAVLALQPMAAQAGSGPHITATVGSYATIIHVQGSNFPVGDKVKVVESYGGHVIGKVTVTASLYTQVPPLPCSPQSPCHVTRLEGGISVDLPPVYVHCDLETVAVRAYDLTAHTHSNLLHETMGTGPC